MVSTMPALGHLENVLFGVESAAAYGTAVSAGFEFGYIIGGGTNAKRKHEEIESIGQRNIQEIAEINAKWDGTINAVYQHARPLWLALGSVSHSGTVAPFIHTITELNMPPSITIVESHSGLARKITYNGVRINTLQLNISKDKSMSYDISWVGVKGLTASTASAAVFSTQAVFPPVTITAYIGTDLADPTTQLFDVQTMSFKIDNKLGGEESISGATITQLAPGGRGFSGEMSIAFETDDLYQRFMGVTAVDAIANRQTPVAFKISATDGATPVNSLVLTLYGCKFSAADRPLAVGGIIHNKFSFTARALGSCIANDAISSTNFGSAA